MIAPEGIDEERPRGRALSPNELLARRLTNLALSHQRIARGPERPSPAPRHAFRSATEYAAVRMEDNGISPVRLGRFSQVGALSGMAAGAVLAVSAQPATAPRPDPATARPWERLIQRQPAQQPADERPWRQLAARGGSSVVVTRVGMVVGVILLSVMLVSAVCQVARTAEGADAPMHPQAPTTPTPFNPDAAGSVAPQQSQQATAADVRQALNTALAAAGAPGSAAPAAAPAAAQGWGAATTNAGGAPSGWGSSAPQPPQTAPIVIPPGAVAIWPVTGPITSFFGPSHPLGIDIGVNTGTPIRAMAAGVVTFAGGDPCCSYGYYVDIDHGNGVTTRYGHMVVPSALRPGQRVRMGDAIGLSGTTGFSTGPHLHFEVRLHGVPVNPLLVLPG